MCGLVGMAGNLYQSHNKMFRDMLLMDVVRGWDSTGILAVSCKDRELAMEKMVGCPPDLWEFFNSKILDYKGIPDGFNRLLMGHNRAATYGKITDDNAHPFEFDHIIGAHNGSLTDWKDLEGYSKFDVDSKAVFLTIAEKGIEHCWKNFLGAAALTWWDDDYDTINLIRNEQRPLYLAYSKQGDAIFWASEPWMILSAARRNKIDLKVMDEDLYEKFNKGEKDLKDYNPEDIYSILLKAHNLHTFSVSHNNVKLEEVKELEKKSVVMGYTGYGSNGYQAGYKSNNPINHGWAAGSVKGDKVWRGQLIKLITTAEVWEGGQFNRWATFEFDDGSRIKVFPQHYNDWTSLKSKSNSPGNYYYNVKARPRYILDSKGKPTEMIISFDHLEVVKYVMPNQTAVSNNLTVFEGGKDDEAVLKYKYQNGQLISSKRWDQIMDAMKPKGRCVTCENPLEKEDHEGIKWLKPTEAICPDCAKDPMIVGDLMGMNLQ